MRWLLLLWLAGCAVDTSGLMPADRASDASVDARATDASLPDAGALDVSVPGDGGTRDAPPGIDALDECAATKVLLAADFEGGFSLESLGWTPNVELPPFEVRLSTEGADGPGSDGGRYLLLATTDDWTGSAESGSATSPWLALPPCADGTVTVAVRAVAGDIDFTRDGERFELTVESSAGDLHGTISFEDQDDRNIGRPAMLLAGHRWLESGDFIAYEESWPVPAGPSEIRVSVRSWITHWDDFGGIDQLVVSYTPAPAPAP